MKSDDELTTGQAARLAGVSIQTIHNWIDAGMLAAREEFQGRKRVRFVSRAVLEAFRATLNPPEAEPV